MYTQKDTEHWLWRCAVLNNFVLPYIPEHWLWRCAGLNNLVLPYIPYKKKGHFPFIDHKSIHISEKEW